MAASSLRASCLQSFPSPSGDRWAFQRKRNRCSYSINIATRRRINCDSWDCAKAERTSSCGRCVIANIWCTSRRSSGSGFHHLPAQNLSVTKKVERTHLGAFSTSRMAGFIFRLVVRNAPIFISHRRSRETIAAYISPPAADPNLLEVFSEDNDQNSSSLTPLIFKERRLVITWNLLGSLLLKEKLRLAICAFALIGCSCCTLSMPLFSGRFFETLIGACEEPLWKLLSKLSFVYFMEPILTVIFVTNMITIWEKVMTNLRSQVFRRILTQKVEFFDRHKVGELTGMLSSELGSLKDAINENVSRDRGFRAIAEMTGTVVILFSLSAQLAPLLGVLMLSISVLVAVYRRRTIPVFRAYGLAQASISDYANETFSAIRTVRSFGGERRQLSMLAEKVSEFQKSGMKLGWLKAANESWTRVVIYVSLMALYILGGYKVKMGELAVGTVVSFIGYTFTLTFAVQGVVTTLGDVRVALASIDRINSVIDDTDVDESLAHGLDSEAWGEFESTHDSAKDMEDGTAISGRRASRFLTISKAIGSRSGLESVKSVCEHAWSGDVSLEGVHFAYPLRPDVEVLKGINLLLKQGNVTAVVGSSGAGKSTIVQLLMRFYEPTRGRITLAGEDIRRFNKREWTRAFSIVNQDPILFAMSVADNIAYGLPDEDVPSDEIIAAARAANAHEFIISLPLGYNTLVGERGSLLSGGQRQRIAIARALLKNSPLLILDEATSALDTVSEQLVQEALDHLMKGRTTIVIAHRLSTVQRASQIAVCADGRIVELGSHSDLVAHGGMYASLVDSQRLGFE
eukprot:c22443_g1_i1 orf=563-2965(-)